MLSQALNPKYDFTPDTISPEDVGATIVEALASQGFCVFLPGLPFATLSRALDEVEEAERQGRFGVTPSLVVDGLLGETGSTKIAELDAPDLDPDFRQDGEFIRHLDQALTQLGLQVMPHLDDIGIQLRARTIGLLHLSGSEVEDDRPGLTYEEGAQWLNTFAEHRLMLLLCLGPETATLELQPFGEADEEGGDDGEAYKVLMEPGTMMVLRPDALSRSLVSEGRTACLSCFYQGLVASSKQQPDVPVNRVAKELEEWAEAQLKILKEADPMEAVKSALPRKWELYKSHMGFTTQPIGIHAVAGRATATFEFDVFLDEAQQAGVDLASEVPFKRWDHSLMYDPDAPEGQMLDIFNNPYAYSTGKTNCKHACFMDGVELFDEKQFRLSRAEAMGMDPGQRLLLEVGYESLVKGGYKGKLMNSRGAVLAASDAMTEWTTVVRDKVAGGAGGACGAGNSINCGRLSFTHGMKGPCLSFDQEAASALAATSYASTILTQLGTWERAPFAVVYSYSLILSQISWLLKSLGNKFSKTGRSKAFDQSADGFIRGEVVVSAVLRPMVDDIADGKEPVIAQGVEAWVAEIAGIGITQTGRSASLGSQDIASQQEAVHRAVTKADISPLDVDMCECNAVAGILNDAVEVTAIGRVYRPDGFIGIDDSSTFNLQSMKNSYGDHKDSNGLSQLIKVSIDMQRGAMAPTVHLRLQNPYLDLASSGRPVMIGSEVLDFELPTAFGGCHASNIVGTNAHCVVWGHIDRKRHPPLPMSKWEVTLPSAQAEKKGCYISDGWWEIVDKHLNGEESKVSTGA
mmetsp:Transcript_41939/g.96235  ORF Transcript_41939/g.96235 Transcript_41939/m.96235 type:complete len:803 (+) Transcript_41939:73-2481(+)